MKHKLKIMDFTEFPGGREKKYGPGSDEEFRNDYLLPALQKHDLVEIDLEGPYTFAPGFVSELTDQVIRRGYLTYGEYRRRISFVSDKVNEFFIKDMFEKFRDELKPAYHMGDIGRLEKSISELEQAQNIAYISEDDPDPNVSAREGGTSHNEAVERLIKADEHVRKLIPIFCKRYQVKVDGT